MADHAIPEYQRLRRDILPIPDRPTLPVRTFDAKGPATGFPRIKPLHPPPGSSS
jgi:hypothetical protein